MSKPVSAPVFERLVLRCNTCSGGMVSDRIGGHTVMTFGPTPQEVPA